MSKALFVWPWSSSNLKYHNVIDTLANQSAPGSPKCLYPAGCLAENVTEDHPLPEPGVNFKVNITSGNASHSLSIFFVAGTGLDNTDPNKSNYDRSKATIDLTGSTTAAVIILVSDDETNVNQHIQPVHGTLFGKGLSNSPTFVICLDDPSFAKGKEIQQKAMGALSGYGSSWVFKSISSSPSVDEVNALFSEIVNEAATASAAAAKAGGKAGGAKTGGGGGGARRGGCQLF